MTRDELVALRDRLVRGDPPYELDDMGNMRRGRGGVRGVNELIRMGDHNPDAAVIRMALETCLQLTDHLLERMRKP